MEQLFLQILNISGFTSFLIPVVLLIRLLIKKAPKWITCLLWGLVAIRLICPFSLESKLSLIPWNNLIESEVRYDPGLNDVQYIQENNTGMFTGTASEIVTDYNNEPVDITDSAQGTALKYNQNNQKSIMEFIIQKAGMLSLIWIGGAIMLLIYAIVSYAYLRKKVSEAIPTSDMIFICDSIDTSFLFGLIVPRIYLPSSIDEEEAGYVIMHETAHLRRRDYVWKGLGFILLSVYWFNPLVWLAYIMFEKDIELACDEKVISDMNLQARRAYANALLSCSIHKRVVFAYPLNFGEIGIKERVRAVKKYKKGTIGVIIPALVLCIAVAVCFLTVPVREANAGKNEISNANSFLPDNKDESELVSLDETEKQSQIEEELVGEQDYEYVEKISYEFDGCTVEPRWYVYDGLTLFISYDVTKKKDSLPDISISSVCGNTQTVYDTVNASGDTKVMTAVVRFPYYNPEPDIIFSASDDKDSEKYSFPVQINEGNYVVSKDIECSMADSSSTESIYIKHIDISNYAMSVMIDTLNWPDNENSYKWMIVAKMKDGQEKTLSAFQEPLVFSDGSIVYLNYIFEKSKPDDISEIFISTEDRAYMSIMLD